MKTTQLMAALVLALAGSTACAQGAVRGEVLEVQNVPSYTYLRLKTASGETWAAVSTANVKKGDTVQIGNASTMANFESKTLGKRFDTIVFGQLVAPGAAAAPAAAAPPAMGMGMGMGMTPSAPAAPVAKVPKATGPEARTVAEVVTGRGQLKDKTVLVRARVVKVNAGIMGKNWLHVQDGSGTAQDSTHDVLVTTKDTAAVGDVVSVRGTVRTDVTLGPGYQYAVLIEQAAVRK